ncbi:MAG: hypothetical protein K2J77_11625 [Oscillospiraceae bacterium]|nr:hypothetical protein [Oscillospiraceae bacterium]
MKLSKQERIAAIVVIVLVIIVAGVFIFIKPNIETILSTKESLAAKKKEYEDDVARAATKDQLKTQILSAYDDGKNLADMFFPELKAYEVDNEFRAFLEQVANRENIHVDSFSVSEPGTAGLSTSVYTPSSTSYALKNYVNQGSEAAANNNLIRQRMIQTNLGEAQTIGASTVSFTLYAASMEDLLKFADAVNNYEMPVNGKKVRKAIELNGVSFSDARTSYLLNKRGTDQGTEATQAGSDTFTSFLSGNARITREAEAEPAAATPAANPTPAPAANTAPAPAANPAPATPAPTTNEPSSNDTPGEPLGAEMTDGEESMEYYLYKLNCTITFYSIERMSDPSATLAEQDTAA